MTIFAAWSACHYISSPSFCLHLHIWSGCSHVLYSWFFFRQVNAQEHGLFLSFYWIWYRSTMKYRKSLHKNKWPPPPANNWGSNPQFQQVPGLQRSSSAPILGSRKHIIRTTPRPRDCPVENFTSQIRVPCRHQRCSRAHKPNWQHEKATGAHQKCQSLKARSKPRLRPQHGPSGTPPRVCQYWFIDSSMYIKIYVYIYTCISSVYIYIYR